MNCAECKELLVAYVEGLLDESQEKTVSEHLKDCQSCRAEASELKALQGRLVKNGKALSENQLEDKVLNRIIQEQNVRLKTARKAGEGLRLRRIIMKSKITRMAAAAAIIFAVLIGIYSLTGGTPTFADVIKPILNARTVVYDFIIGDEKSNPVIMHETVVGQRIRRTISNLPGMTQIIDMETGKMLVLQDADKTAVYVDIKGQLQEMTRGYIEFVREVLMELKDSQKVVNLGEQEIEGQKAIGFSGRGNNNQELKIWADPKTAVPIRVELRLGREFFVVLKNFKFDVPIDDSQISMDVPPGYTLQEGEVDFTKGTEEDFIESLRIWAEVLLDGNFPEVVGTEQYMKQVPLLGEKLVQSGLSDEEVGKKVGLIFPRAMFFLQTLEIDDKYHYAGKGVKLGDADKAIFWYQPKESESWRIIYGDLSVKDVAEENLPK
jgi:outer membrane lipoprotein-sorting protein